MSEKLKVRVYHTSYGCDTGCCGHIIELDGKEVGGFEFGHPDDGEDYKAWAIGLAKRMVPPECLPSIDWDSLDVSEVSDY